MRQIVPFNNDWYFHKTANVPTELPADWQAVTLPHTWNAVDGQDGGNDYWRGTAMYVKCFSAPVAEKVFIEFQGAAMTANVWLNGRHLCCHEGGYSTFRVDLTDFLKNENLLCVSVDNSANDRVYPQKADFTFYGGLYREVSLILVPDTHFELVKDGMPGIKVTPVMKDGDACVTLEAWTNADVPVTFAIDNQTVTAPATQGYARAEMVISNARVWHGVFDPYLYAASATIPSGDSVSLRFGCRSFDFDRERGFILNGKPYPLRGVSRHQDRAEIGNALTKREHLEDFEIIREIGANTVRLAHYQQAQVAYDICDEMGLIVWAEIPYITQHMPTARENTLSQMRELVVQCHQHPSIVCWGLSNEITASGSVTEDMLENHRLLNDLCHHLDPTRKTAMAHVFMLETDSPMIDIPDIGSYNLYFGWYLGELTQNDAFFDSFHDSYPHRIIGLAEYGADANAAYQAAAPERGDYTEGYQCLYHEHLLEMIEQRPYLWATHAWNMYDFAADGRDEGGKHGVNQKGLVTIDRKIRKDAFYLYKAAWSNEPFVHLCGKRYQERHESMTQIKVYSNQDSVSLYVDNALIGTQRGKRVFTWDVPLRGEHSVKALSGELRDSMIIRKVGAPNPAYRLSDVQQLENWFDKEAFNTGCYSIQDTLGDLKKHPQAAALLDKIMAKARASRGDVASATQGNAALERMMSGMTLQSLLKQAGGAVPPEAIKGLNSALQQISKG